MKQTPITTIDTLADLVTAQHLFKEKTRINIYLPKSIVKVLDDLAGKRSRGDVISSLVVKEVTAQKKKHTPYGVFSGAHISQSDIEAVTKLWQQSHNQ